MYFLIFSFCILICPSLQGMHSRGHIKNKNSWENCLDNISNDCCKGIADTGAICCNVAPCVITATTILAGSAYIMNSEQCIACPAQCVSAIYSSSSTHQRIVFAGIGCCAFGCGYVLDTLDKKYNKQNDPFFTGHQDKYE